MQVGDKVKLKIEKLVLGGNGLGRIGRLVVFVPYTCPGDEVLVEIDKVTKNYANGKILEIINPALQRETPQCPHFFQPGNDSFCGGCNWQHINYSAQLDYKLELVKETLKQLGGVNLEKVKISEPVPSPKIWRYRNKMQMPLSKEDDEVVAGFYGPQTHKIVDCKDCFLHSELMNEIVKCFKQIIAESPISIYNENTGEGTLRHLILRQAFVDNQVQVVVVVKNDDLSAMKEIAVKLTEKFPQIQGVFVNINPNKTNVILGNKTIKICGKDYLTEHIGSRKYFISPDSFLQVNKWQAEKMYDLVLKFIGGNGSFLWDIYCGSGTISLWCASVAKKVYGVEEKKSAIRDACINAGENNINNAQFFKGKAENILSQLLKSKGDDKKSNVFILDPPRAGCLNPVLKAIIKFSPKRVVYVSCDPSTLARDIKFLEMNGYFLKEIQPIDMFPQTSHIECVALIEKIN